MVAEPIEFVVRRQQMVVAKENQREAPANVITGDAKLVKAKMMTMNWPATATRFLSRLFLTTFGDKGKHHQRGEDEHFSEFDLGRWTSEITANGTPVRQSQILRTRAQLINAHIITFSPHPTLPGCGIVGWNMNTDEWVQLGPKGGNHNPEGNPLFRDPEYQAALHTLKAKQVEYRQAHTCQSVNNDLSKCKSTLDSDAVNVLKHGSSKVAPELVSRQPQEGSTKKGSRSSDTHVSGDAASAGAPARASPSEKKNHKGAGQGSARKSEPKRSDLDPEGLKIFRAACFKLMRDQSKNFDTMRTAGQAKTLFDNKKNYTVEQVEGCWRDTIRDPKYNPTNLLEVKDLTPLLVGYLDDPVGYRAKIDEHIEADKWRKQQRERSKHNGNHRTNGYQPGHPENWKATGKARPDDGDRPPEDPTTDDESADVEGTSPEELAKRYDGYDLF